MILSNTTYKEYFNELRKQDLETIVDDYNSFNSLYNNPIIDIKKDKKDTIVTKLLNNIEEYFKCIVKSLDIRDYSILKELVLSEIDEKEHKEFIKYLSSKKIIIKNKQNELFKETKEMLKKIINDKNIEKYVEESTKFYCMCDGIITAYGVVSKEIFDELINYNNVLLNCYYKKPFKIDNKKVYDKELKKEEIEKLLKKKNIKDIKKSDLYLLGIKEYHHNIKEYKELVKLLKEYYILKRNDIRFIDDNILNKYLYNNKNEKKQLEKDIIEYFEFKKDKLKDKMLNKIYEIKDNMPLWNKRGYSSIEVIKK